uniref:Activating transcription factor 6 beta n=1 Tax=Ornithorhynchus anatinus TaxID=9258 RepID=A0A6I8N2C5_ORNAN
MAAELLVLSDIADPARFFADNLLSAEDWDSSLYTCLDGGSEEQTQLFRCLDLDVPLDSGSLDLDMDISPPEPPWDLLPIFPDLQVKSEPSSPCSSSSSSSSSSPPTSPLPQAPSAEETSAVKAEAPGARLCLLGDDLTLPPDSVQITVGSSPDDPPGSQSRSLLTPPPPRRSLSPQRDAPLFTPPPPPSTFRQILGVKEVLGFKKESQAPQLCLLGDVLPPAFGSVQISVGPLPDGPSGQAQPQRKPLLQPKPVIVTSVPLAASASSPSPAVLLQPLAQPPPVPPGPPVVLLHGPVRVQAPPVDGPAPPAPRPERKSIVPAPTAGTPCPPEVDAKLLKRQQRMIKNRESACQSRRKKKEYVQGLEARLQAILADNQQLRRENAALRRRLEGLLAENSELKFGAGNRKVVCVMVFLLFIAFNFGPVSITESPSAPASLREKGEEPRPRRHLLEFSGDPPREAPPAPEDLAVPTRNLTAYPGGVKELLLRDLDQLFLSPDCRHFNRTESLRLADELSGWVRRHQSGRKRSPQPRRARERQKSQLRMKSPPARAVPPHPPGPPERESLSQLQLYRHPKHSEPEFLDAIDRREDTFYVVSFRRDHLLLPAISHNKTSRPKMSLVMPAMAPNETLSGRGPGDYEVMMQIECEVMDTRVIHIKSSTVPPSLRPAPGNATRDPLPPPAPTRRPPLHRPLYLGQP